MATSSPQPVTPSPWPATLISGPAAPTQADSPPSEKEKPALHFGLFCSRRRQSPETEADIDGNWRGKCLTQEDFAKGEDKGYFWTSNITPAEKEIDLSREPAKVRPLSELSDMTGRKMDLVGVEGAVTIGRERKIFNADKRARFDRWLVLNKGLLKGEAKPDFVSGSKRLRLVLATRIFPRNRWSFYAVRMNDVIFLKNAGSRRKRENFVTKSAEEVQASAEVEPVKEGGEEAKQEEERRPRVSGAIVFKRIAVGQDPHTYGFNEFEEPFAVTQFSVGSGPSNHKLLLRSCGICYDEEGKRVMIRSDSEGWTRPGFNFMNKRYLEYWTTCITSGATELIVGHRNTDERLKDVEVLNLDQVWAECDRQEALKTRCFQFLQSVLDQVKTELSSNDNHVVKKFEWDPVERKVVCTTLEDEALKEAQEKMRIDWLSTNVFEE